MINKGDELRHHPLHRLKPLKLTPQHGFCSDSLPTGTNLKVTGHQPYNPLILLILVQTTVFIRNHFLLSAVSIIFNALFELLIIFLAIPLP